MPIGIQELVALTIVGLVVGFALYRRWRRRREKAAGCADCASDAGKNGSKKTQESQIRIYRRKD